MSGDRDIPGDRQGYPGAHVFLCFESLSVHMESGITRGAGTTSTVMRMASIRTWKPTWRKLQMPNVNTRNMQEEIHLIDIEQQQKKKVSRKLIKQSFC